MDIPPAGRRDDRGGPTLGGYLYISPLEHICTVYCNQAHNLPVSCGGVDTRDTGLQVVVVSGSCGCGGDADGGLGGGTDGGL